METMFSRERTVNNRAEIGPGALSAEESLLLGLLGGLFRHKPLLKTKLLRRRLLLGGGRCLLRGRGRGRAKVLPAQG